MTRRSEYERASAGPPNSGPILLPWYPNLGGAVRAYKEGESIKVAKRRTLSDAERECASTRRARELLEGLIVGQKRIRVPNAELLVDPNAAGDLAYVTTSYVGVDLNTEYYFGNEAAIALPELLQVVDCLAQSGVRHEGLLPRNLVVNSRDIWLLDWESATFSASELPLSQRNLVGMTISWSYYFDRQVLEAELVARVHHQETAGQLTSYENKVSSLLGVRGTLYARQHLAQGLAMDAESAPDKTKLPFKLDDISHLVGEILGPESDALLDLALVGLRSDPALLTYWSSLFLNLVREAQVGSLSSAFSDPAMATTALLCLLVDRRLLVRCAAESTSLDGCLRRVSTEVATDGHWPETVLAEFAQALSHYSSSGAVDVDEVGADLAGLHSLLTIGYRVQNGPTSAVPQNRARLQSSRPVR